MDMNVFKGSDDYVVTKELMNAVNVSIALQKPLLIKGEPGTGKTMLAESISKALDMDLIIWGIKSTTKAQEGLYVYDTVQRLYDSQFGEGNVSDIKQYIKLGKLGEAFTSDKQVVLLIDEIDKADLEFPNDLLWELDKMEFYINETKETIKTKHRPIVIITSNAEKELPDAFLRRCIFHYIEFPDAEKMEEIINVHFGNIDQKLCQKALEAFYEIRKMDEIQKKPSTSELTYQQELTNSISLKEAKISGVDIENLSSEMPFVGVLLKKNQDIDVMHEIKEKGYSLKRW